MADEPKKDLTGIIEYSKRVQSDPSLAGELPAVSDDSASFMQEQAIEKVDDFESLADYSKAHPMPEPQEGSNEEPALAPTPPPPDDMSQFPTSDPALETPAADPFGTDAGAQLPPSDSVGTDFSQAVTGINASGDPLGVDGLADAGPAAAAPPPPENLADLEATGAPQMGPPAPEMLAPPPAAPVSEPAFAPPTPPPDAAGMSSSASVLSQNDQGADPSPTQNLPPEPSRPAGPPPPSATPMERIRNFSERVVPGRGAVPASFPFSLRITGRLTPEEREKLLDVLERERMGFSPDDLTPQLETGHILLPRISEYAGVVVIQALRGAPVKMRLAPSDAIFATESTRDEQLLEPEEPPMTGFYESTAGNVPEAMPVTSGPALPEIPSFVVIDVVTASASLRSATVEAESSLEFQEAVQALQRELKYKAYLRGATAILNFSVTLTQLSLPTNYRVTASGSAVRAKTSPVPTA